MDTHSTEILKLISAPFVQDAYNTVKELFKKGEEKEAISEKDETIYELKTSLANFNECLDQHLNEINEWSKEANLNNSFKPLTQIYVRLKFYLNPRRTHMSEENAKQIELTDILKLGKHIAIYGGPGSGKSTSMMFICQQILSNSFEFNEPRTPIVIRFRELNPKWKDGESDRTSISKKILDVFGIKLFNTRKGEEAKDKDTFEEFLLIAIKLLNSLRTILILDGYDEISSYEYKRFYADEISKLSINLNEATLIITSRTGDFQVDLNNTLKYEIAPLTDEQIRSFILNWLQDTAQAEDLFNQIKNSPFSDTAARPLTLSQLCSIYDKSASKKIPDKPKSVYSLVVFLLLRDWNESRGIKRASKYASFEIDRKEDFLFSLAYLLSVKYNTMRFSKTLLREVYKTLSVSFSLPEGEVDMVLDELESHNGLFIQTGYESYEFSHLSLQEYLTAKYIVSIGTIPVQLDVIEKIPSAIAIATVISANQTEYFYNLIFNTLLKIKISSQFLSSYLSRLAIEKPDFSISPIVSISLLSLLDKNIKILHVENKGNRDATVNALKKLEYDYKPILSLEIIRSSFNGIDNYYKFKHNTYITKYDISDYFISLKRTKIVKDGFHSYLTNNEIIVPNWIHLYLH